MIKNNKKILAIIPARSGSKGLKDKNILDLNNKPLMSYTINAAIESNIFQDVFLSTDSKKYKEIGESYGAYIPFLRDESLATDTASTKDLILDTLKNFEKIGKTFDYFMLLQPTSPLRNYKNIQDALKILEQTSSNSVVSVCECDHSPYIMNILDKNNSMDNFLNPKILNRGRQQVEKFYRINGAIYLSSVEYYLKNLDFYKENCKAYIMDKKNSVDIDDIYDFLYAKTILDTTL